MEHQTVYLCINLHKDIWHVKQKYLCGVKYIYILVNYHKCLIILKKYRQTSYKILKRLCNTQNWKQNHAELDVVFIILFKNNTLFWSINYQSDFLSKWWESSKYQEGLILIPFRKKFGTKILLNDDPYLRQEL